MLLCISSPLFAQKTESSTARSTSFQIRNETFKDTVWIITGKKPLSSVYKKWKFDFVLDARQTLVSGTVARLAGLRLGMEYRRVHRIGVGFYNLGDGIVVRSLEEVNPEIVRASLNIRYSSIFYEREMFFNPKWELSLTAHLGRGRITGNYILAGGLRPQSFPTFRIRAYEFSTTAYYHLNWWISLGGGIGYRIIPDAPDEVKPIYNSPIALARIRFKLGKLVKSIWNHDIKYTY